MYYSIIKEYLITFITTDFFSVFKVKLYQIKHQRNKEKIMRNKAVQISFLDIYN